jgi:predicted DsbA family dithiol-disulfide isomerase
MLTGEQMIGLATSSGWLTRVQSQCWVVADEIRQESAETPNHANRTAWAATAWQQNANGGMAAAVATRYQATATGDGSNITDEQILAAVRDAVNTFATGG